MKLLLSLLLISGLNVDLTSGEFPTLIGRGQMPALASGKDGSIHLVYGIGDSLLYSTSHDKGKSFSKPELIKVVEGLAASATRGPQIAVAQKGLNVIATTDAGNIWSFTKRDQGKWSGGNRVNDVDSVNLEGFVDLASNGGNDLFVVWLDLRGNKRNKLYGSRSSDGGNTWSGNKKVYESPDSTVCECCRVSAAMKENNVYVMFRNQLYGKRDLHLITSKDAGQSFGKAEKLGVGTWALQGCPMDGGGLTLDVDGNVHTVWRRESKIYSCEPGHPEIEIGEGKSCTIENVNGQVVYAWVKNGDVVCKLPDGNLTNLGKGASPVLLDIGTNNVLCAWENEKRLYYSIVQIN